MSESPITSPPDAAGAEPRGANPGDRRSSRRWGLVHGESVVAGMALAALVILIGTLGLGGWWSLRAARAAVAESRYEQAMAACDLLARNAELQLAAGELTAARRAMVEAKAQGNVGRCRILLPDGRVVADSDPTKITAVALPARWPSGPLDAHVAPTSDTGPVTFVRALTVRGKGPATLEASIDLGRPWGGSADLGAGLGLLAVVALGVLWLVYRRTRRRLRSLGLIREALIAAGAGERSAELLSVASESGAEAAAWNRLLREAHETHRSAVARELGDKLERRRESRGELELAADSLGVGIAVLDERGCVRHANGAAAAFLRTPRADLPGRPLVELLTDEHARAAVDALATGKSSQRRTWEVSLPPTAGDQAAGQADAQGRSSVLRVTLRPMRREDSCSALVTIEDVTQQRAAEAARSEFVAQATHELRTPLTNMRLCLESVLDSSSPDPAEVGKSLNLLNGEVRRLERMVGEMLSVAEIEAGSLRVKGDDVRLDALFEALRADVQPLAGEKSIELRFELPPKLPVLQADRDKLVLALHNLVGNAIKYTPAGGRVTVAVRTDGRGVTVDVSDTGIGIRPEEQELIFDRFYRARDPRVAKVTGTGLGLALSREVARIHGGDVTVQSELDKGSTFTLTVPLTARAA